MGGGLGSGKGLLSISWLVAAWMRVLSEGGVMLLSSLGMSSYVEVRLLRKDRSLLDVCYVLKLSRKDRSSASYTVARFVALHEFAI